MSALRKDFLKVGFCEWWNLCTFAPDKVEDWEGQKEMYAVVEIAGQQFKVTESQKIYVHRLAGEVGDALSFDRVLLVNKEGVVSVGTPCVSGARVNAKILDHVKGDKVIVFKKKRRKGYRVKRGHRQQFTQIEIGSIEA